jgi:hypothetical protein
VLTWASAWSQRKRIMGFRFKILAQDVNSSIVEDSMPREKAKSVR